MNNLAGFWSRFFALLIDFIILLIVNIIFILIFVIIPALNLKVTDFAELYPEFWLGFTIQMIGFTTFLVYFILLEYKFSGSIGKIILKIKISKLDSGKVGFLVILLRTILFLVTSTFFGIGLIFFLFNNKNQCLHDILTKTYVVKK